MNANKLWNRKGDGPKPKYFGRILHKEFAERLNKTADLNPNVPSLGHGRLTWLQQQLSKKKEDVTLESVSKWFSGESMPHRSRAGLIAEILKVDEAWLMLGTEDSPTHGQRRLRNALVDGAVNLIAGLAQMDGATVAFPDEDDRYAITQHIDLHAIIRGASYAIHVIVAQEKDGRPMFLVPTDLRNTIPVGVVRHESFSFSLYEITDTAIELATPGRTGKVEVTLPSDDVREIKSFKERF